jgi:hypothetical protein
MRGMCQIKISTMKAIFPQPSMKQSVTVKKMNKASMGNKK